MRLVLMLVGLVTVYVEGTKAQGVVSYQSTSSESSGARITGKRVTLQLKNVALSDALDSLASQAGVRITYGSEVTSAKSPVSYSGVGVAIDNALSRILTPAGLVAVLTPSGKAFVVKRLDASRRVANGVITGKVTDAKTGKGIAGANVSVGVDSRGVSSGEDGEYRLSGIAAGTHAITVRLVGYAKQSRQVTVGQGATVTADFKLEPSANVLEQVIVTGTAVATELKAVPNAITVITAKQIEARGITRIDQLFRGEIPGLFSLNLGSFATLDNVIMYSRGATALSVSSAGVDVNAGNTNPIKTYIDGVELVDPKYLSQIDPKSIERIEILTGPQASTIYGSNAINGVMQIFTKRGSLHGPQLKLGLSGGIAQNNFSNHLAPNYITDASLSGIEGRWSYNVGASWNYAGAWTPSKQSQRFSGNGGGRMEMSRLSIDISARQGLTKNLSRGDVEQGRTEAAFSGLYRPGVSTGLAIPQTSSLNGRTIGAGLSYRPVSWWSHDLTLGTDATATETIRTAASFAAPSDTSALSINTTVTGRTSQSYNTTIQMPVSAFVNMHLTAGADHWRTRGSLIGAFSLLSLTGSLPNASVIRDKSLKNSGAFVQGQVGLGDALFLTYGVRADWNPNFGDNARVKPGRYGMSYTRDVGPVSAKLRGSYGRSIRPPGYDQELALPATDPTLLALFGHFDQVLPNPDLGPEHQQGGEGGIELYYGNRGSLVITRYNQTVDNLISRVGNASALSGPGLDSVRSLSPQPANQSDCSSTFRDADGYCYKYQQQNLNIGSIRNQGWEMQGGVNSGPFALRGTYSWAKSRVIGITPRYRPILTNFGFTPGQTFKFAPEHSWSTTFTYQNSQSTVAITLGGVGARYIQNDEFIVAVSPANRLSANRIRMSTPVTYRPVGAGYSIADMNASHRFSQTVDLVFKVQNLTNYYQNDFDTFYASIGRQAQIGARLTIH